MKNKYKAFAITCLTLFGITLLSGCTKDDISDLKEEVSNLQSQINDLESQISTLQNQMKNEIQSVKDEYNPQIETLKSQISSLNEELTALKTNLESAKKELQENLNKNIHELRTHIDEEVSKLQNQITQNENELSSLKTKHDQDVLALKSDYEKKISSLQEDIDNKKAELEKDYNDKLSTLETTYNTKVQSIQNDIDACNVSIASFKETYKQEKQSLEDDYNNKINALKEEYQNKVSSIESSISSLEDSLSTLREEMNTLIANIQKDYNDKIDDLVTRVGNLENVTYYTITFDTNGGEGTFTSQKIAKGDTITKPADPRKDGYDFDGWYTSLDEKWSFSGNVVTRDMTLTARYLPHTYTIHIDFGDGAYNEKNSYTLSTPYLSDYSLPTPTYYGHRFAGYVDQNKKTVPLNGNYSFTEDLELSTNWDPLYVLTLDSDGGTSYEPIAKYDYNPIESLPMPTKDGATFQGWYLGETKIEFPYTPTSFESFTLKAKWRYASDTFTYEFFNNDEEVKITGYLAKEANVEIPETINNKPVTLIGAQAFQNNTSIESIDLCSNISDFEEGALNGCTSLQELMVSKTSYNLIKAFSYEESNVPESFTKLKFKADFSHPQNDILNGLESRLFDITIGKNAFLFDFKNNQNIEKVEFEKGANQKILNSNSFWGCSNLEEVVLQEGIQSILSFCFYACPRLERVNFPSTLQTIGRWAFYGDSIKTLVLSQGITDIGEQAFSNNPLCFITLPKTVTCIEDNAFGECYSLINIFYEGDKTDWVKIGFSCPSGVFNKIVFLSTSSAKMITSLDFDYYETSQGEIYINKYKGKGKEFIDLQRIFFNKIVKAICSYAFSDSDIVGISIPDTVSLIESRAFLNCKNLNTIKLSKKLKTLEDETFRGCSNLSFVEFGSNVNKIGDSCFDGCSSLLAIDFPAGLKEIGKGAFSQCGSLTYIGLPNSLKSIKENAFKYVYGNSIVQFRGAEKEWQSIANEDESLSASKIRFDKNSFSTLKRSEDYEWIEYADGSICLIKCFNKNVQNLDFTTTFPDATTIEIGPRCFTENENDLFSKIDERIVRFDAEATFNCNHSLFYEVVFSDNIEYIGDDAFGYGSFYFKQPDKPESWGKTYYNAYFYWYSETSNTDGQHWHYVDGKPTVWTE